MSRIGRKPIPKSNVDVKIDGRRITVKGPKGENSWEFPMPIEVEDQGGELVVSRPDDSREARERHGLSRTIIANMIVGVTDGFRKAMVIRGTGYRVQAKGQDLEFNVGYSHSVLVKPPKGITFRVEKPTEFVVEGIDKQLVGQTAAKIREIREPEPYKAKGIAYADEQIRRKAGKAGK